MTNQRPTPSLISLTGTEIAANAASELSKGSIKLPTLFQKGELTFNSPAYKMKAQPSQFTPQLTMISIPTMAVRMCLRQDLSI